MSQASPPKRPQQMVKTGEIHQRRAGAMLGTIHPTPREINAVDHGRRGGFARGGAFMLNSV